MSPDPARAGRGKLHTDRRWSENGAITDGKISQVYAAIRAAVIVKEDPKTGRKTVSGGRILPHPEDVSAVLRRILAMLESSKARKVFAELESQNATPHLRFLKDVLRRHVECGLTLDQSFGYARVGRGAPPLDPEREKEIACAFFKRRFLSSGRNADQAAGEVARNFGIISKTQVHAAFKKFHGYALRDSKCERRRLRGERPMFTPAETRRLEKYYSPRIQQSEN